MIFLLGWLVMSGAQEPVSRAAPAVEPLSVPPSTLAAQAWLLSAYPALAQSRLQVEVVGNAQHQRIEVSAPSSSLAPEAAGSRTPLLQVEAHFTRAGVLERLAARGVSVSTPQLDALRAWVRTRTRSLTEIDAEIRRTGGTFGPTATTAVVTVVQRLPAMRKESGTIVRTAFEQTADLGPVWVVEVQGARRGYRAAFEPFTGQLIAVSSR